MRKIQFVITVLLGLLFIWSCDDDVFEVTPRDFPRLNTMPITEVSVKGARFNAEFRYRGDSEILNFGFVWNENPFPTLTTPNTDIIQISENIKEEIFSIFINSNLNPGSTYYVRAFVQTPDYTVYGVNQTFVSKGSGD